MKIRNTITTICCTLLSLAAMSIDADAVKAYPRSHMVTLEDGDEIEATLIGDEHCHALISKDGFIIAENNNGSLVLTNQKADLVQMAEVRRRSSQVKVAGQSYFPTTGNLKGVVLLVEFADNNFHENHGQEVFNSVMNEPGFSSYGATGSARDYFVDQSHGLFTPDFDVFGPIKLTKKMSYYGANNSYGEDSNAAEMVKEACETAESELGVDFSKYDYDEDGEVDFVYVIYAGYAESYGASSNTIWPHASNITSHWLSCEVSGKTIGRYACSSELKFVSGDTLEGIGTFCHEFSHVLGLPDIYNTRSSSDFQLGQWDIMDQGNYNNDSHTPPSYSAFEKASLGWMELTELTAPSSRVELPEFNESNIAYRISTADENEFFTLENRQQVGWDMYQPCRGLMIIHVCYDQSAWDGNFVNSGILSRYDLVEADGNQSYLTQSTDLYPLPDNNSFTDYSSPSSLSWSGAATEKGVTNIQDEDGLITFRFMKDRLAKPAIHYPKEIGDDYFIASWDPVEDAASYILSVREDLPDDINPVILEEDFSALKSGDYPTADMTDIGNNIEDYLSMTGWYGSKLYQAGGWLLVGYYGQSGVLNTPAIDLSSNDGKATVAFRIKSYPGKSVNYAISVTDLHTGNELASFKGKATKTEEDILLPVEGGTNLCRVTFSTTNERVYIDRIRVVKGDVGPESVWNCGPKDWKVEGITGTECRVENLVKGVTYHYFVEAVGEEIHMSLPSEEMEITTGKSGVTDISDSIFPISEKKFNLWGIPVDGSYKGVVIVTTTYNDGTIKSCRLIQ